MEREPEFKPRKGQVDYTFIRYAPVINCVLKYREKVLIVERNRRMRLYPGYWNGISGFLDDNRGVEAKVKAELKEEIGITSKDILSIQPGPIFHQESAKYKKTWIVHPILVEVKTDRIKLDWEAQNYRWVTVNEVKNFKLLPGFDRVVDILFPQANL